MVSSHEHSQIPNEDINGVLVVQNKNMAQTMAVIDLTWPDGTPVKEEEEYDITVNNYRANSQLLAPARSSRRATCLPCWRWMCAARPAACDYIVNVKGGSIAPECNDNWKITGNDWDEALHQKAVDMLAAGELTIPTSEDGRTPNVKAITAEDVQ